MIVHCSNGASPSIATFLGIVALASLAQRLKARVPISVRLVGMTTSTRLVNASNA